MSRFSNNRNSQLKQVLEGLYLKYNHFELIKPDPLQFVYNYSNKRDMEIAGFLAACLAYGRVHQIEKSVQMLLGSMGQNLFGFVKNFSDSDRRLFKNFRHRFTSGDDICDLLELLGEVLKEYGGMEKYFLQGYNPDDNTVVNALSQFCNGLLERYKKNKRKAASKGLEYLLCDPARGSACKRLNLFLRWMVRDDDVDAGLWKSVDKAKLIVPVDVHMSRLCRFLKLYERKTVSISSAVEITEAFAEIEPSDPVKYDFALSRIGIIKNCTGVYQKHCDACDLFSFFCRNRISGFK